MAKTRIAVIVVFVLALASGLVAGMLITRLPAAKPAEAARSPLAEELGLTPEQNQEMRQIWEGVRTKVDDCFVRAMDAQKQRDEAFYALLTDTQKAKVSKSQQEYADRIAAIKAERDQAFLDAVNRTEKLLSEPQRRQYRKLLKSRLSQEAADPAPDWLAPGSPTSMPQSVH